MDDRADQLDEDERTVVHQELLLLQPDVRDDAERVRALLHGEFVEHGSSGRVWDRSSVAGATAGSGRIEATGMTTHRLGPDVLLLTYRSRSAGREALRSSVWLRTDGTWLLRFHQGTPVPLAQHEGPGSDRR